MACGNQGGEVAHEKYIKKSQEFSNGNRKAGSLTTSQKKQKESEMQQKQKAANEKKAMQRREK